MIKKFHQPTIRSVATSTWLLLLVLIPVENLVLAFPVSPSVRRPYHGRQTRLEIVPEASAVAATMDMASLWLAAGLTTAAVAVTMTKGGGLPKQQHGAIMEKTLEQAVVVPEELQDVTKEMIPPPTERTSTAEESVKSSAFNMFSSKKQTSDESAALLNGKVEQVEDFLGSEEEETKLVNIAAKEAESNSATVGNAVINDKTKTQQAENEKEKPIAAAASVAEKEKPGTVGTSIAATEKATAESSMEPSTSGAFASFLESSREKIQSRVAVVTTAKEQALETEDRGQQQMVDSAELDGLTDEIRGQIEQQARKETLARMELKKQRKQDQVISSQVLEKLGETPASGKSDLFKSEIDTVETVKTLKLPKDVSKSVAVDGEQEGLLPSAIRSVMKKKRSVLVVAAVVVIGKRLLTAILSRGMI